MTIVRFGRYMSFKVFQKKAATGYPNELTIGELIKLVEDIGYVTGR